MTVAELIEHLKAMPQDALVVTPGFDEAGIDEIEAVTLIGLILNVHADSIGPHEAVPPGTGDQDAVFICWSTGIPWPAPRL